MRDSLFHRNSEQRSWGGREATSWPRLTILSQARGKRVSKRGGDGPGDLAIEDAPGGMGYTEGHVFLKTYTEKVRDCSTAKTH